MTTTAKERCKEQVVWDSWGHTARCRRNAVRDGFCAQHHPDTVKARDAVRVARWETESARTFARYAQQDRERAVLAAAKAWVHSGDDVTRQALLEAAVAAWPKP